MTLDKLVDLDRSLTEFNERVQERVGQNLRMISLSMYGNPEDPRFSAVWDERPQTLLPLKIALAKNRNDFKKICKDNLAAEFYPVLVSATGGEAGARFSAVFEQSVRPPIVPPEMSFHQLLDAFKAEVETRAEKQWIIHNATIYDDATTASRVTAIWRKNTTNTAWMAYAGLSEAVHNQYFKAETDGWARLAFVTASSRHRFLAVYRDDQIAPIGTGFAQEFYGSIREFKMKRPEWLEKGFYHQYFQGFGSGLKRRYVALYVVSNKPIERTARINGKPQVDAIDNAVLKWMKHSNIRGAALAIVKDTRLVLARGYTWAEPDYPDVTPKTMFRLGSCSKMITSLSIHQLAAEGNPKLDDPIAPILQLKTPDGQDPQDPKVTAPNHEPYLKTTVGGLLESTCKINADYEKANLAIVEAAGKKGQVPATHDQIASWIITQPPETQIGPNDGGFFLAAEVVKRVRGVEAYEEVFEPLILKPLNISRFKIAHSLHKDQKPEDARHHARELTVVKSVMSPDRPFVHWGHGEDNYQTFAASGGFAAAALDYARLLAALNCKPYNPLGSTTVDSLIGSAKASGKGHGFDAFELVDPVKDLYQAYKGGLLDIAQTGIYFEPGGISYVMLWNGLHYGKSLRDFDPKNNEWWPRFHEVLTPAKAQAWSSTDLFPDPDYAMPSFPATEGNWRHCTKCQSLYLHGNPQGDCLGEGKHDPGMGNIANYHLMVDSTMDYGEKNWRRCINCRCLFFDGDQTGKCTVGDNHDAGRTSSEYSLVVDSPYNEHDENWRRCKKCQTLFSEGTGSGKCAAGGAHESSQNGVYSIAET
ncbi:serine hydrolase [Taklimakanibacter deserti]|uniref:serine hydrolase n=1 Tax=Taklimakanibacter deserti TaxID=2267839 RepID=UPI000E649786